MAVVYKKGERRCEMAENRSSGSFATSRTEQRLIRNHIEALQAERIALQKFAEPSTAQLQTLTNHRSICCRNAAYIPHVMLKSGPQIVTFSIGTSWSYQNPR
jgi:hypothetical protein